MKNQVLPLLKARLGISTESRDSVLSAILDGIVSECEGTYGIILKSDNASHVMFVLDWATWKYNHPEDGTTPRSIQFRLKNLIIKRACEENGTNMG